MILIAIFSILNLSETGLKSTYLSLLHGYWVTFISPLGGFGHEKNGGVASSVEAVEGLQDHSVTAHSSFPAHQRNEILNTVV